MSSTVDSVTYSILRDIQRTKATAPTTRKFFLVTKEEVKPEHREDVAQYIFSQTGAGIEWIPRYRREVSLVDASSQSHEAGEMIVVRMW